MTWRHVVQLELNRDFVTYNVRAPASSLIHKNIVAFDHSHFKKFHLLFHVACSCWLPYFLIEIERIEWFIDFSHTIYLFAHSEWLRACHWVLYLCQRKFIRFVTVHAAEWNCEINFWETKNQQLFRFFRFLDERDMMIWWDRICAVGFDFHSISSI